MTVRESTVSKIQQLPESLLLEVNDFIDFVLMKQSRSQKEEWIRNHESQNLSESDLSTYLRDLEQYEDRLARGEIQWRT